MRDILVVLSSLFVASFLFTTPLDAQAMRGPTIPTVQFCSLGKPSLYDNQLIRINAILVANQTPRVDGADSFLYSLRCRNSNLTVVVEWSDSLDENAPGNKAMQKIRDKPDKRGNTRVAVTLVGEFEASGKRKYGHLDWADSQFVIHSIERVSPIRARTGWPGRLRR